MRTHYPTRRSEGNTLVVILVTMVIIGMTLASYLNLVANQNLSVMRSQAWNSAIPLAEAGIEEAMAHLNSNTTNRTADGWTIVGTNVFKQRFLGENKYEVFISKDLEPPVIIAKGYVKVPLKSQWIEPPRSIRVTTTNDSLFAKGMVAKGQIDLSGNNIRTDSFDSSDTNYSNNGIYDPAKNKDGGDVATNSSVVDSLDVWNADIYGKASTGPGGNVKLGSNGAVGSKAWHAAGNIGLEPGWSSDDMNVYFPDVKAPWQGGAFAPGPMVLNAVTYKYGLTDGRHELNDLKLSGDDKVIVNGHAVLLVREEIDITGNASIVIAPGASLHIYMEGDNAFFGGNGIVNQTGKAESFSYWGMNSNKEVGFAGNAAFVGTIYAPHAALTMGGGGSNAYDFVGAVVGNNIKLNGHYNFHYDEALKKWGPKRGYTITSWNEGDSGWNEI